MNYCPRHTSFQFYFLAIHILVLHQEPRRTLSWALELKDCSNNFNLSLCTLPNGVRSRLPLCTVSWQNSRFFREAGLNYETLGSCWGSKCFERNAQCLCMLPLLFFFVIVRSTNQGFRLPLQRKPTVSPWLNKRDFIAKTHDYYSLEIIKYPFGSR